MSLAAKKTRPSLANSGGAEAVLLPRGRLISPAGLAKERRPRYLTADSKTLARYRMLRDRYGRRALVALVFLAAAYWAAFHSGAGDANVNFAPISPSLDAIHPASSSDVDEIERAYARFGEEVRAEARKHVAEIRASIRASAEQNRRAESSNTTATSDPPVATAERVYKIIQRYAPRHSQPRALAEAIVLEAQRQRYDPLFVAAVIKSESAFNALARSNKGAQGLMQIMPATGQWLAREALIPRGSLTDPGHNLELGIRYLKHLEEQYNGDRVFTLIAYNWGPGRVESAADGKRRIPPEVVTYAIKILNDYRRWRS
jgi:soluble lytic murein transglycosylase